MSTKEILKASGLKATPQRRIVYEVLQELCHAAIDEIITNVGQRDPDITVATVYRILDQFCKAGLISRLSHSGGKSFFDITPSEHHHVYLDNNKIVDYNDPELTELIKTYLKGKLSGESDVEKISVQIFTKERKV